MKPMKCSAIRKREKNTTSWERTGKTTSKAVTGQKILTGQDGGSREDNKALNHMVNTKTYLMEEGFQISLNQYLVAALDQERVPKEWRKVKITKPKQPFL